jgi:RND family efflux transporter MFP subunit
MTSVRSLVPAALAALWAAGAAANPYECLIEPNQTVEVRSSVEGIIEKIFVKRGDRVRAGQVLVQLESAQNRLEYAHKKLERQTQLEQQKFVSAQARDEAEAEKRILDSELRAAREDKEQAILDARHAQDVLNRRVLRSPFDGIVLDRMLNPGDLAESGTGRKPILKLVQVEPLRVEVVLPLAAWGKLKPQQAATVLPEALGGSHAATVKVIDSVFDTASGTFGVRLEMPNAGGRVPAGIRCRVDFPELRGMGGNVMPVRGASFK